MKRDEWKPGDKTVYVKNDKYKPRSEPANGLSGGKVVKVDRVEWITMPDAQTALNALQSGDVDFVETPPFDLLPMLESNPEINVAILNKFGFQSFGRMNFLHPPFDNVKIRRAAMLAINQKDVLDAQIGNPKYYKLCGAFFICDTPLASDEGGETLVKGNGMAQAKKALAESGYDGTPVVILAPTDQILLKAQPVVVAQLLREAGFKVDLQAMDWQTVVSRRAIQKPPKEGGWNMFFTYQGAADSMNPLVNGAMVGKGTNGGWFGWSEDPRLEELRDAFARATSPEEQKKIAFDVQKEAYDQVIYVPLGQFQAPSAWRKSITAVIDGPSAPLFWNVERKD